MMDRKERTYRLHQYRDQHITYPPLFQLICVVPRVRYCRVYAPPPGACCEQ